MKNKSTGYSRFIIAIIMTMLMSVTLPFNAVAVGYTLENFETGTVGTQYTGSVLSSYVYYALGGGQHFYVENDYAYSGTQDFVANGGSTNARGWWKLTYSKTEYMTSIDFFFRPTYVVGIGYGGYAVICFQNITLNQALHGSTTYPEWHTVDNDMNTIMLWLNSSLSQYKNSAGNWITFATDTTGTPYPGTNEWRHIYVTITDSSGLVTYQVAGYSPITALAFNATRIANGYRIDRVAPYTSSSITDWYYDDVTLNVQNTYPSPIGCSNFSGQTPTGRFSAGGTGVNGIHISSRFNVPVTTTISGVEIQISQGQYVSDHNASNYGCAINGVSIGQPSCFYQESYYYVVQWTCNISLINQIPNFDFSHTRVMNPAGGGLYQYWDVGCGVTSTDDLNGDGEVAYWWQDNSVVYHWIWFMGLPFFMPTYGAGSTMVPMDIAYRFWSNGFTSTETFNFTNSLGLSDYETKNTTGYVYNLTNGYNVIRGTYTLASPSLSYTLNLYVNGTRSSAYGFPMACVYPGTGFGFSPSNIGKYRMQLNSTHAVANVTAWVIGMKPIYSITSNPVISNQFTPYTVIADYHNPQGNHGGAAMDTILTVLNTFYSCTFQRQYIENNQTTSFLQQSNSSTAEYWGLYTFVNNLYSKVADHTHNIRIPSIYKNEIHSTIPNYNCPVANVGDLSINIAGSHMFPGGAVKVYINTIYVADVGDDQIINFGFAPRKFGSFNIKMYLAQNNSNILLAQNNFTVSPSDLPDDQQQPSNPLGFDIRSLIPFPYDLMICIAFIIFMVLLPTIIIVSLQKKITVQINIPQMVMTVASIMSGFLGFMLTVMWGLLSWVWFFAFLFVLIIILAIVYFTGSKNNESE